MRQDQPHPAPPPEVLHSWEKAGLVAFLLVALAFGGLVEWRSAFAKRRMTDLTVYTRTAWAVRSGENLYHVADEHGWHYIYPPLFAILFTPLAEPPPGVEATWVVPYPVTVAVWYLLSVGCLALGVHWLASAVEDTSSDPAVRNRRRYGREWWRLRMVPVLVCLPAIGSTLSRGQVNLLLLLLLCAMTAALLRGRSFRAGLWHSGAITLKIIPVALLLYALWRRDTRWLAGCALGLALGLLVLPAAALGPSRFLAENRELVTVVLRPGLSPGGDRSRDAELFSMTTTDNNSLLASLHHLVYARLPRAQRPGDPPKALRVINLVAAALFTGVTLRAAGWQRGPPAAAEPYRRRAERSEVIFVGLLIQLMLLFSPVTHLHYFALWLPLVMGLLAADRERRGSPGIGRGLLGLLGLVTGMNALPRFPKLPPFHGNNPVRDLAGGMYGSLLLWVVGVVILWKQTDSETRSSAGDETR